MLTTKPVRTRKRGNVKMVFADDYRELQYSISKVYDDPLPPCYFCSAEKLWHCGQTGEECEAFEQYCEKE